MYVRMYVCMYVRTYACMYVCMYVRMYVCMHVCRCVCMYVHMYAHIGIMPLSAEDAIKKFNVELLEKLPLEDVIFFAKAKTANLFPLGTADSIEAKPTRAEKVAYFLQHVVEPGAKEYLPKLLIVMKDSKNDTVVELAGKIEAAMTPWPGTHIIIHSYILIYAYMHS